MSNDKMVARPRTVSVTPPLPPTPPPQPQTFVLAEKMELRVVEYTKGDRLVKTELQYRMHHFDQWGGPVTKTEWEQVDRVRIDIDENTA
jgi:hypothetical protein